MPFLAPNKTKSLPRVYRTMSLDNDNPGLMELPRNLVLYVRLVSCFPSPILCTRLTAVQFVAMKLGHGYTIEEQLTNTANGGIQIDVYPSLLKDVKFYKEEARSLRLDLGKSPKELNIKTKEKINLHSKCVSQLFH